MPEQVLRDAETSAEKPRGDSSDGAVDEARAAEGGRNYAEESSFRSNVSGRGERKNAKGSFKGGLKKKGPLIAIVALLGIFAVLIFIAQSAMPFAIVNRLIEEYNTNGISAVLRADNILDIQMSSRPGSSFALSDYQLAAFKENNILPLEQGGGTVLAYQSTQIKSSDGKTCEDAWRVAYGTQQEGRLDAGAIRSELAKTYSGFTFNCVSVISLQDAMQDAEFKTPYTTASKTWRGGNSGWYDELAALGENVNGFKRSRWFNYAAKKTSQAANNFVSIAQSMVSKYNGGDMIDVDYEVKTSDETTGEDITTTKHYSGENAESTLSDKLGLAAKFTSYAQTGVNIGCAIVDGLMGVQTVLSTYNRLQKINLVSGYMEAVQSVQAGSTESEPMHEYNDRLTATDSETGKTAIEGMGSLFTGEKVDLTDPDAQAANIETTLYSTKNSSEASSISNIIGRLASNANGILTALQVCNYANATLSFLSAGLTIASFFTGGITGLIALGFKKIAKAILFAAIKTVAPQIIKGAILAIGNKLVSDVATSWLGKSLGHVMVSGGNSLLSSNHQIGGGSPGSSANFGAFRRAQEAVIAEEAEYQRYIRSPFDTTSQHTFLGSIIYSLVPMANSAGIGSAMKNISSVMTNSLANLLPKAAAIAETSLTGVAETGDCPVLDTLNVQGDAYCNPNYMTDQTTIAGDDYTPEEIIETEKAWGYVTENNGKLEILSDGYARSNDSKNHLRNYIIYCGQRTSNWGIADANIANDIKSSRESSSILAWIAPDIDNALSAIDDQKNIPWVTGSACVASESNEYWCENKIHQRFIEDQRFLENAGISNENAVTAYLKNYYEENPLDNSFEGILARYSGMTKDDVIATLELIDGLTYLANYHPEERLAFGKEEPKEIHFEQAKEVLIAEEPKYIVYETIRNRVVLV